MPLGLTHSVSHCQKNEPTDEVHLLLCEVSHHHFIFHLLPHIFEHPFPCFFLIPSQVMEILYVSSHYHSTIIMVALQDYRMMMMHASEKPRFLNGPYYCVLEVYVLIGSKSVSRYGIKAT